MNRPWLGELGPPKLHAALFVATVAVVVAACSGAQPPDIASAPSSAASGVDSGEATDLSPATVAYLKAWAANDVPTMVANSAPGSPARGYADYWGRVFDAGRQDTGSAQLTLGQRGAVLVYADATYRLTDVDTARAGLVTWTSRPGGPLADRIVAAPVARASVGGMAVTAHQQYVNTEQDLRVTLTVRRPAAGSAAALAAPRYAMRGGDDARASLGAQGRTGVVPLPSGRSSLLVSVPRATPGGRLTLVAYRSDGRRVGTVELDLPG